MVRKCGTFGDVAGYYLKRKDYDAVSVVLKTLKTVMEEGKEEGKEGALTEADYLSLLSMHLSDMSPPTAYANLLPGGKCSFTAALQVLYWCTFTQFNILTALYFSLILSVSLDFSLTGAAYPCRSGSCFAACRSG